MENITTIRDTTTNPALRGRTPIYRNHILLGNQVVF